LSAQNTETCAKKATLIPSRQHDTALGETEVMWKRVSTKKGAI